MRGWIKENVCVHRTLTETKQNGIKTATLTRNIARILIFALSHGHTSTHTHTVKDQVEGKGWVDKNARPRGWAFSHFRCLQIPDLTRSQNQTDT